MIRRLIVRNFRNYKEAEIEFCNHLNLFIGDNGQGKTSLLEAVHLLMVGRSFRTAQVQELIHHQSSGFYLEVHFDKSGVDHVLRFSLQGKERKILYNSTPCTSISSLFGILVGTLIASDDQLVKGSAQERRLFLDLQMAQYDALYVHHLSRYYRAMKQRNFLLRQGDLKTIELWENEMANSGAYIINKRHHMLISISPLAEEIHNNLTHEASSIKLSYLTKILNPSNLQATKEELIKHYQINRPKEAIVKATFVGPHRDDINLELDNKNARTYASEGQKRICVTALRLASWQHLKLNSDVMPLMLVDDLAANLDEKHQQNVMEQLEKMGQVFITSTNDLPGSAKKQCFVIQNGTFILL